MIEEFFKGLKTGCKLEERQMESASTILNVLAILLPQAWRVLLLRSLSDETPDLSWRAVLDPLAFKLLKLEVPEARLNHASTVLDVMLAVASFGGHIRYNGRPGWITLQRGWRRLSDLTRGARLLLELQQQQQGPLPCARPPWSRRQRDPLATQNRGGAPSASLRSAHHPSNALPRARACP